MSATICPYQIMLWAKHAKTVKATLGSGPGGLTPEVTATTHLWCKLEGCQNICECAYKSNKLLHLQLHFTVSAEA